MKSSKSPQPIQHLLIFTLVILMAAACENKPSQESDNPAEQAAAENDIKFEDKKLEKDAQFLVDATAFNLDEVQLARLGQQKGSAPVKTLSQMMVGEHEKALTEVRELAKAKQVSVPDSAASDAIDSYNTLKEKSGDEFDKAFCDRLIETHKKAVEVFEKESADSRDQELKEYATTKLPQLRAHLDTIFSVQKKVDKD